MKIRVAIDGPVGAGKSTIAKECAKKLGFIYIDTGALYRAVGLFCSENGIDMDNGLLVGEEINKRLNLEIKLIDGTQHVFANNADVSDKIRTPEISMLASKVSAIPEVRSYLLELQRSFAEHNSVIMDGRDIGTVILPNAEVKIFLTADAKLRAKRRYDELTAKGVNVSLDEVLTDLEKRDYDDSHREIAPLKQAEDAVLADTSELDFNGSVELVIGIINNYKGR